MANQANPFALVRASDYTDVQINSLWVELGSKIINTLIEPKSGMSKYILGGKGSGKTHILRYNSYQVARLRTPAVSGLQVASKLRFLAVFLRATALDAARFEVGSESSNKWQQLFGVYLELRLAEAVLEALCDIKKTSPDETFNDRALIRRISDSVLDPAVAECKSIEDLRSWLIAERRRIDDAVNNAAFTGALILRVAFSIGALCLPLKTAIGDWHESFSDIPLIYLLDEIENFSRPQQEVVNSLIRYGEGRATFRITGRLYARKTLATIGDGEENREGSEFNTVNLDVILKSYPKYTEFAKKFVLKRLGYQTPLRIDKELDPRSYFVEVKSDAFYEGAIGQLGIDRAEVGFIKTFAEVLKVSPSVGQKPDLVDLVVGELAEGFPVILRKLNLLQFCKKHKKRGNPLTLAQTIRRECTAFLRGESSKGSYANAYGHFKGDLFAQLCRESKKQVNVPYAGFETFVNMSSGNPRNLLIVLGRAYEIAAFREIDFVAGQPLSIELQTQAAMEAARFMYERDTNYGSPSDVARVAAERLALVLRTARYSLNIPEVSPLAVSFSDRDLTPDSRSALDSALNYSFLFEVHEGRPDRNSERLMRKAQLNPLLSPRWGLPTGRRGDLSLSAPLANAIFDPKNGDEFEVVLKSLYHRWNNPFGEQTTSHAQDQLF